MTGHEKLRFAAILTGLWAVLGGLALFKGAMMISRHEGDALHLIDFVLRMAAGQTPHLDFRTPLGVMGFAPIAGLVRAGLGIGMAFLTAQVLVAVPVGLAAGYAAVTRLRFWPALVFGAGVMILMLALVHGEPERAIAVSMHYNRWAWAVIFVVLLLAVLPHRQGRHEVAEGALIGSGLAAVALIKATYFVAFAPVVIVALLTRGGGRGLGISVVVGLIWIAVLTPIYGPGFWAAYLRDLIWVATSEVRATPGASFADVVAAPKYIAGTALGLAAVLLLRRGGAARAGLLMLLMLPGFFYVTFQNFGNDPQWLLLLAVLLLAHEGARGAALAAALALVSIAPSYVQLATSPVRHAFADAAEYTPLVPGHGATADLLTSATRAGSLRTQGVLSVAARLSPEDEPLVFLGETFPDCAVTSGLPVFYAALAKALEAAGQGGRPVFVADLFSPLWLYGDHPPLRLGAPWYYGGLPGMRDAELLLVPRCAVLPRVRSEILAAIEAAGTGRLTERLNTDLLVLYEIAPEP